MPLQQNHGLPLRLVLTLIFPLLAISILAADPFDWFSGLARGSKPATTAVKTSDTAKRAQVSSAFGKLPLSFETNQGQFDPRVRFKARGLNYDLFLTAEEVVMALCSTKEGAQASELSVLRMKFDGARKASISGVNEAPGKFNYFIDNDRSKWRSNVPAYAQVRYSNVYSGIDLVYHGNQQKVEYDFVIAPGASPQRIKMAFAGAEKIVIDNEGNLILRTAAGELSQQKPFAYQEVDGHRREITVGYKLRGNKVTFQTGPYDKSRALVIDPVLIYSTYVGGGSTEQGLGIAVDSSGNAYITGNTFSNDFPLAGAFQNAKGDSTSTDAFIVKLNAAGNALVYATYLGGNSEDNGTAIAVDAQGSAYVAGGTLSGSFPRTVGVLQDAKDGSADAFLTKLSPDGSSLSYSTFLGGDNNELAFGVVVDSSNRAYVVGRTDSTRFRTFTFPTPRNGSPAFKSTNNAGQWAPISTGITASTVSSLAIDPSNSNILYAATNFGVFKSIDAGTNWSLTGIASAVAPLSSNVVVIDPATPSTIYVGSASSGVYKSTDGGATYVLKSTGFSIFSTLSLAVDPIIPSTIYAGTTSSLWKSTNGGDTWTQLTNGLNSSLRVNEIAIDPANTANVYIATNRGLSKSINGGANWSPLNQNAFNFVNFSAVAIDPLNSLTLYAGTSGFIPAMHKSTDGGTTWTEITNGLTYTFGGLTSFALINSIAIDPITSSTLYVATIGGGIYKSTNGGAGWSMSNTNFPNGTATEVIVDRNDPAKLYAGTAIGSDVFAIRLNSSASAFEYFSNFGGTENDEPRGVAVDADDKAYVAGVTSSVNFPTVGAFQSAYGGSTDAFVTKLNAAGTAFDYSTYLGGNTIDQARAIAVRNGAAYIAGQTLSSNFPVVNSLKAPPLNFDSDAFVTKVNASGVTLDFSTCLGGSFTDQALGIALDSTGAVYVTGSTFSPDFPTLVGPQTTPGGVQDAFVTKLDPAGPSLVYSTYLGAQSSDQGNGIAVNAAGDGAFIVGTTSSNDFPTVAPFQSILKGSSDAFVTKIGSSLEFGVTMTDTPDPVNLGSDLTYTITVKNNGELPGTGVTLTDTLPAGAALVSATSTRGSCSGTTSIVCALGTMNGNDVATIQIVIKPPAVTSISNTATVTSNEVDPVPANNTATVQTQVDFADLSITGATAFGRVAVNGRINYLLTVKNLSGKTANSVTVVDDLPADVTFVSCTAQGGTCGGTGNNRTVTFSSLAVGQSALIVIAATANAGLAEGTIISNTATVSSSLPDSNPANNSATTTVTVTGTPLLKKANGLIAFATSRILTVKADASELPTQFPIAPAINPRWSPDGAKLAYSIGRTRPTFPFDSYVAIEVVNADGTGAITLADNSVDTSFNNRSTLAWSPDGTRVAYVASDRFIYLANADGSGYSKLPNSPSQIGDLDWSSDGSRLVFAKDAGEIYVMNIDGSGLTKLVALGIGPDGPTNYLRPSWSPDMSRILFSERSNNNADVLIMNSDGTGRQRLLNHSFTFAPAWSPDGARVAFYNGTELYVIDLDGTDELRLATAQDCCNFGSIHWQPIPTGIPQPPAGPPPQTFTISGHVSNSNGSVGGATLKLSGSCAGSIGTDANGNYLIVNLPAGGSYTITPTSFFSKYDPPSRSFSNLQQNVGGDFVATSISHTISGRLTNQLGQGMSGQPLMLTRFGSQTKNTTTDGQGFYSFTNIFPGDGYSVIPQSPSFSFDAIASFLPPIFSDQTLNFVGFPNEAVRFIGGRITDPNGRPLAGHVVTLSGGRNSVIKTDADGFFRFGGLPIGQNYLVTPSTAGGFAFFTPPASFVNLVNNQGVQFTATIDLPSVQFSAPSYSVSENGLAVEVTATRSGNLSASGSVDYETVDATASSRTDYAAAFGTLRFAPGESTRSFTVLVSDDVFVEGARTLYINLLRPSGVVMGPATVATVIITDDDLVPSPANPIDDAEFFVKQHYADFLNRAADPSGLDFWKNQITSCGSDQACRELKRINVSAAFFLSIEFQETGYLVYRLHHASFGTAEQLRVKPFLRDTQEIGRGVVVGVGNWQEVLEANKRAFMETFVLRQEFVQQFPLAMAPSEFVDKLNANCGGFVSSGERDALVSDLSSGAKTRGEVLRAVAENQAFSDAQKNRAFVLMQYFGYLRRAPDEPPDADFAGFGFWLGKLNQFNGNFVNAEMVKSFLISGEYRQRFGTP